MEDEPKIGQNESLVTRGKRQEALRRAREFCTKYDVAAKLGLVTEELMLFETYFAGYFIQKNPLNIRATERSQDPRMLIAQRLPILGWFVHGTLMSSITGKAAVKELTSLARNQAETLGQPIISSVLQNGANFVTTSYFRQDLDQNQRRQMIEDTLSGIKRELDSQRI